MGATSTRRPARGTIPSLRTPLPAITNGARAWTTPSEPCSPRWPPWSSQLCAAGVEHAQVGRGGMVEQLRDVVVGERIGVGGARRIRVGDLRGRGRRAGRATGRRSDRARDRRCARSRRVRGRRAGTRRGRRHSQLRTCRSPVRRVTMSTIGDSPGSSSTSSARSRSLTPGTLPTRPPRGCVTQHDVMPRW